MQKLALVPPLAQALEPVLAHVLDARALVLVRARAAQRAVALLERLARRPVGRDAEAVLALQEVGEAEIVLGRWGRGIQDLAE